MTRTCSTCFNENPDDVDFCEACGIELTPTATRITPSPPPPIEEVKLPSSPPPIEEEKLPSPPPPIEEEKLPSPPPPVEEEQSVSTTLEKPTPTLLIAKNPGSPVSQFPLEGTSLLIGRFDPDLGPVEIDLEGFPGDETISRHHAEIYLEGGYWKIKDLGSVNGVFIKKDGQLRFGSRIISPEPIHFGDEISIAKIRFLLQ